jgi:hypothetical protein
MTLRAVTAAETLARRAAQCSFSSAFHIRGSETRGFSKAVENSYVFLVAPAVVALGGATLYRLLR